jgi:hypothetical protein
MFNFEIVDEGIDLYDILANCERILETTVRAGSRRNDSFLIEIIPFKVIHVLSIN